MSRRKAAIEWARILHMSAKEFNEQMYEGGMLENGKVIEEAKGYYEIMNNGYGTIKWDPEALDMAGVSLSGVHWYCDNCNDYLNAQSGFKAEGTYKCKNCGCKNGILAINIIC